MAKEKWNGTAPTASRKARRRQLDKLLRADQASVDDKGLLTYLSVVRDLKINPRKWGR